MEGRREVRGRDFPLSGVCPSLWLVKPWSRDTELCDNSFQSTAGPKHLIRSQSINYCSRKRSWLPADFPFPDWCTQLLAGFPADLSHHWGGIVRKISKVTVSLVQTYWNFISTPGEEADLRSQPVSLGPGRNAGCPISARFTADNIPSIYVVQTGANLEYLCNRPWESYRTSFIRSGLPIKTNSSSSQSK